MRLYAFDESTDPSDTLFLPHLHRLKKSFHPRFHQIQLYPYKSLHLIWPLTNKKNKKNSYILESSQNNPIVVQNYINLRIVIARFLTYPYFISSVYFLEDALHFSTGYFFLFCSNFINKISSISTPNLLAIKIQ